MFDKKEYLKIYKKQNKEKIAQKQKEYRLKNKEKIKENRQRYYQDHREEEIINAQTYQKEHKQKIKIYSKKYSKEYGIKNKEKISQNHKEWYLKNRESVIEKNSVYAKRYKRERYQSDVVFKLRVNISTKITKALKKFNQNKEDVVFLDLLPYSLEELKIHIEKQWEPWMNWTNYGKISVKKRTWNIDHIYPQSKLPYDSLDHPNFLECWKLENLRPLEALKNIQKRDSLPSPGSAH